MLLSDAYFIFYEKDKISDTLFRFFCYWTSNRCKYVVGGKEGGTRELED